MKIETLEIFTHFIASSEHAFIKAVMVNKRVKCNKIVKWAMKIPQFFGAQYHYCFGCHKKSTLTLSKCKKIKYLHGLSEY